MPDTLSTYKRKYSDAQIASGIRTPSTTAMKYQTSATYQYIESLDKFADAGMKLADTYFTAIANRDARDADTQATKLFRDRRVEILNTVKGKDADGLLDRETDWAQKEFEKWKKDSKVSAVKATEIWRSHMDSYLNKTGAYMVEQQAAYDKQSRLQSSDTMLDSLVDTKIGDTAALKAAMDHNKELFVNDPMMAERQNDKAIMVAVTAWTRQNPGAAVAWFKKNKEQLKKDFGQKFINVTDVIDRAEAKMQREAEHAATMANINEQRAWRHQQQQSEKLLGDAYSGLLNGTLSTEQFNAFMDDPRVLGQDKLKMYHTMKGMAASDRQEAKAAKQEIFESTESDLMRIGTRIGTSDDNAIAYRNRVMDEVAAGNIDYQGAKRALDLYDTRRSDKDGVVDFAFQSVGKYFEQQKDVMGQVAPENLILEKVVYDFAKKYAREHPTTVYKDFNINDPNSVLMQTIRHNQPKIRRLGEGGMFNIDGTLSPFPTLAGPEGGLSTSTAGKSYTVGTDGTNGADGTKGNSLTDRMRKNGIKPTRGRGNAL